MADLVNAVNGSDMGRVEGLLPNVGDFFQHPVDEKYYHVAGRLFRKTGAIKIYLAEAVGFKEFIGTPDGV